MANSNDFVTGTDNCANGSCNRANSCVRAASDVDEFAYGKGCAFTIDSTKPFDVKLDLMKTYSFPNYTMPNIKVTLSQDANNVEIL